MMQREKVRFTSGDTECAAWHYPGTNGACVIMAGGFAIPKEPATDVFAKRFNDAGFTVLAFDYRRLGESGGQPRPVMPMRDQVDDWRAAIDFARTLPGVDPTKLVAWAFSASAGHVVTVAARRHELAAAIVQSPNFGGAAMGLNAARYQTRPAMLRFVGRGVLDALGGLVGRRPRLVPLAGQPGTVAMLTTPDSADGNRALRADSYPDWQQAAAARSGLRLVFYRPGRHMPRVRCPLLVVVCDEDRTTPAAPSVDTARRAPRAEFVRIPCGHYEPFLSGHELAVEAELAFLSGHVLDAATRSAAA